MKWNLPTQNDGCFDVPFLEGKPFDLVGLGQNTVDHLCVLPKYPHSNSKTRLISYERQAGGQIAGALVCASRLGLQVKYIGKVGSDENGHISTASLKREKIDIASLKVAPAARTHCSFILIDQQSGERTILWDRDSSLDFQAGELRREDICEGRILLVDADDPLSALQAVEWAHEAGIPVAVDLDTVTPAARQLVPQVDFLIVSSDFPSALTGVWEEADALLAMRGECNGFLAATLGERGAIAVVGDRCVHFPAFPVRAVDTTGAGDLFRAGFIYGLLQNWPLNRIMTFANATAALGCTRRGARAGVASLAQILQFLKEDRMGNAT